MNSVAEVQAILLDSPETRQTIKPSHLLHQECPLDCQPDAETGKVDGQIGFWRCGPYFSGQPKISG